MQQCTTDDLVEVVLPHLASALSVWQYLTAGAEAQLSSSSLPDSSAAVAADVPVWNTDLAFVLDQYAALHECIRSFCEEQLENDVTLNRADDGKIAKKFTVENDLATDLDQNGLQTCDLEAGTDVSSVPNAEGLGKTEGRIQESLSERHLPVKDLAASPDRNGLPTSDSVCTEMMSVPIAIGLEKVDNRISDSLSERQSPETDLAASSAIRNYQNGLHGNESGVAMEISSVPNASRSKEADIRTNEALSEVRQKTDLPLHGNYAAEVSCLRVNGEPSDAIVLPADCNTESNRPSESHKLLTGGNTESGKLNENPNPEIGNTHESDGVFHTAFEIKSGTSETGGIFTHVNEKLHDVEFRQSDSCELRSCVAAANSTDGGATDSAEKPSNVKPATESCQDDSRVPRSAKNTQPLTDVQTSCSDKTFATLPTSVQVVNNMLEVSAVL